jgi:uncharacterized protein (TIGR03790 family)
MNLRNSYLSLITMRIFRHLGLKPFAAFLLIQGLLSLSWASVAAALASEDLIVVFNRNVAESRKVADYYAQKRHIPEENLVGVQVSTWEDMTRQEYDQHLLPIIRQKVVEMRLGHRNPAILLVYGIPLRVGEARLSRAEQDLQALAQVQEKKTASRTWVKLQELQGLLTKIKSPPKPQGLETAPTPKDVFKLATDLVPRADRFLKWPSDHDIPPATRIRVAALLVELSGQRPEIAGKPGRKESKKSPHPVVPLIETPPAPGQEVLQPGASLAAQAQYLGDRIRSARGLVDELKFWEHINKMYEHPKTGAAVDSELALVLVENYPKVQWLPNPLNLRFDEEPSMQRFRRAVVMVGRLDGPTPEIARRLLDDALEIEKTGLTGTCYLDARGLKGDGQVGSYAWFDAHLVRLAQMIKEHSHFKVVLDERPGLFPPGSCPQAALYCGWYSLASCTWRKGAVAYHVASAEATTLKRPGSQVWCKRMLEEGVAATLGPVSEPYLLAFPLPGDFFPLMMTGKRPLLEVYFRTVPHVSWQMILIGDPLYTPFKRDPDWQTLPGSKEALSPIRH